MWLLPGVKQDPRGGMRPVKNTANTTKTCMPLESRRNDGLVDIRRQLVVIIAVGRHMQFHLLREKRPLLRTYVFSMLLYDYMSV